MENQLGRQHPSLNSFHHTESLLFQFILSEFLQTFSIFIEIDKAARMNISLDPQVASLLRQLAGASYNSMQLALWDHEEGFLAKLQAYTDLLCAKWQTAPGCRALEALQKAIHKARQTALEALDMLSTQSLGKFQALLDKLQTNSQLLKKSLEKAIYCFKGDENVLFFIVRHVPQFSAIYGSGFVPNLLQKMYPKGLRHAQTFLQKAYARRHFEHLIPAIDSYFSHLESLL